MSYNPEELAGMSGGESFGRPHAIVLNEVSLNGDTGKFRKRVYVGHDWRSNEKPVEEELGTQVSVIFLKIRRKLVERGKKGDIVRQTSEHNNPNSTVSVWPEKVYGKATDVREMFSGLRTVQYVYALLLSPAKEPELVRVVVKGASLGSEAKEKDVMGFYDYVSSFKKPEYFFQFQTKLIPIEEHGVKTYWCMTFERGAAVSEERMQFVADTLKDIHTKLEEQDEFIKKRAEASTTKITGDREIVETGERGAPEEGSQVNYPDEEINQEDIPF